MARLPEVRADLAQKAADVLGVNGYPEVPDSIVTPCAVVQTADPFVTYELAMGRAVLATYRFEVVLLVSRVNDQAAQNQLSEWLSPDGVLVPALVKRRGTSVTEANRMGTFNVGEGSYFGAALSVVCTE